MPESRPPVQGPAFKAEREREDSAIYSFLRLQAKAIDAISGTKVKVESISRIVSTNPVAWALTAPITKIVTKPNVSNRFEFKNPSFIPCFIQ